MRRRFLFTLLASATACDPYEYAGVGVAPPPVVRADSGARVEFWRRATAVTRRVAEANALVPSAHWVAPSPLASLECLAKGAFSMCVVRADSILRLDFREGAVFSDEGNRIRREVFDSLQAELGQHLVRECWSRSWRTLRPDSRCPTLAQIDSSR